ncbi:MAG: ATP-dependent Clp protease ATP-binding subunit ClpX [Lachnospiraceae bacterium]|nr:ATP-dependent Clp protease ATP-binding subunit ClpX [Lachnospiraceae bacterium]
MSDDYNKDNGEVTEICYICRKTITSKNDVFHMPNGVNICQDCLRKTMDQVSSMDFSNLFVNGANMNAAAAAAVPETGEPEDKEQEKPDAAGEEKENIDTGTGFPNISFLNLSDLMGGFGPGAARSRVKKSSKEEMKKEFDFSKVEKPHRIKEMLDMYVVGQEHAKKTISVAVYNHYKRVQADIEESNEVELEKSNILLLGPTGCGKTYLVKTLARLLNVPLAIADATSLTEAGYIGDDIESVVSKLLAAADNDVSRAERGIIFVDEIDKIAKKKETRSRDVSGESVQQGMLKLLEGSEVEVPVGANSKNAMVPMAKVNTKDILFICGGAFPDLDEIIRQRLTKETSIGFNAELKDKWDKEKNILKKVTADDIREFGMIPEFIGRLPVICPMEGLSEDMMVEILKEPKNAIIKQYKKMLSMDGVDLKFTDEAMHAIAKKAMEKDTGARALRSVIEDFMLDIMFQVPKDDNIGRVTITEDYVNGTGGPLIDLKGVLALEEESEVFAGGSVYNGYRPVGEAPC